MGLKNIPDHMTKPGAEFLAERIRRYWLQRGHFAKVWTEKLQTHGEGEVFVIRSNLNWRVPS